MKTDCCLVCNFDKIYLTRWFFAVFTTLLLLIAFQTSVQATEQDLVLARAVSNTFVSVAEEVGSAVVSVKSEQGRPKRKLSQRQEEMFRRFFGNPDQVIPPSPPAMSQGSGFIIDKEGHILTNNHVISDAKKITVIFSDKRELQAEIVGADPKSDLAVLKLIDAKGEFSVCKLGDSESLRVGEFVIAIGAPFGFSQTVTSGIVSAKGRAGVTNTPYENYIQTDAAINPGNSGGPLLNLDGAVVGINTAISSRSGGNEGIGFAIPINMAKKIVKQLIESGEVTRGWIGVKIDEVAAEFADQFAGYSGRGGVLVSQVGPGLPADKAGIEAGDIIISFNGEELHGPSHLQQVIADTPPNTRMPVTVLRDGMELQLTITPAMQPKEMSLTPGTLEDEESEEAEAEAVASDFGFEVQDLSAEVAERLGYEDTQGVLITSVEPESPAGEEGLKPGMLILKVEHKSVPNIAVFKKVMEEVTNKKKLFILVRIGDIARFILLERWED